MVVDFAPLGNYPNLQLCLWTFSTYWVSGLIRQILPL